MPIPRNISPHHHPKAEKPTHQLSAIVMKHALSDFKAGRYPPGFDVVGPKVDGTMSDRLQEKILEFQ